MAQMIKKYEKFFYYSALAISFVGIIGSIIAFLILFFAIGEIENSAGVQIDNAIAIAQNSKDSFDSVGKEMMDINRSFGQVQITLSNFENATKKLGDSLDGLSTVISSIPLGSNTIAPSLKSAATDMTGTSSSIQNLTKTIKDHQKNIADLGSSASNIKTKIIQEQNDLQQMKKSMQTFFLGIKIVAFIGSFSIVLMFLVLSLIAVPQLNK